MHHINYRFDMIDRGRGQNTMTEIEDVARMSSGAGFTSRIWSMMRMQSAVASSPVADSCGPAEM